ncbi:hypothetical protein SAMN05421810_102380 [Amycolatopsis arida]|uniref:Uncharacterized protein n=1 Tax=Amycolatopsis arida TaxID=587909 RepID=A0A1I5PS99_9PSEU|nr:hypothetical protein [Amycolatopsis arida]TDX98587.1 hypothetical protein CLV69_101380 [Amycolatopsis arida]SFP36865.1 hypothetical protein SAMN05421810_102380 [Amycolatopsis arida]
MGSRRLTTRAGSVLALAVALPLALAPQASAAQKVCAGGPLMGGKTTTVSTLADQKITIKVHNHDYRGLALSIRDVKWKKTLWKGVVAPGKDKKVSTSVFGEPPIGYKIAFDVTSNLSNNYTYAISSIKCY